MKTSKGFTLVEIAIVLVIIGLLLGGILKGQEMITQAKIKNVIADMSGVSAAMYGYLDRYRALPGDDVKADRWGGATKGDGNGVIVGKWTEAGKESTEFWDHLRRSGFVSGSGAENPFNAVSGKMGVQTGDGTGTDGVLGEAANSKMFSALIMCSGNLPDKIAISVDAQMDDGVGNRGSVRAKKQAAPNPDLVAKDAADTYSEDGVSTYVVCRQM
ncbi:MAG TPA: prepilin-type N-terminal cleavage/methylation domain-containing protein [Burkholderiales bacterium]|jgi:prepilin-type N-terminal cleavage/methylation domain-containing protein